MLWLCKLWAAGADEWGAGDDPLPKQKKRGRSLGVVQGLVRKRKVNKNKVLVKLWLSC